jgi:hypothetical protein
MEGDMRRVTVVTADIARSRTELWSPGEITARLEQVPGSDLFLASFSISRGDELQAVLDGWLSRPAVVRHLRYYTRPLSLRIGVGLGLLPEEALPKDPWAMNGEPFFRARQALDQAKKDRQHATRVVSGDPERDALVNCIWALTNVILRRWSQEQWDAVHAYERLGSYGLAAECLGIRFQNVHKRCKAAHWDEIRNVEKVMSEAYLRSPSSGLNGTIHPPRGE